MKPLYVRGNKTSGRKIKMFQRSSDFSVVKLVTMLHSVLSRRRKRTRSMIQRLHPQILRRKSFPWLPRYLQGRGGVIWSNCSLKELQMGIILEVLFLDQYLAMRS